MMPKPKWLAQGRGRKRCGKYHPGQIRTFRFFEFVAEGIFCHSALKRGAIFVLNQVFFWVDRFIRPFISI